MTRAGQALKKCNQCLLDGVMSEKEFSSIRSIYK